jgi:hypothetical protein
MAHNELQEALDRVIDVARENPSFYRQLIVDARAALNSKLLDGIPLTIRRRLGTVLCSKGTGFSVPDGNRLLSINRKSLELHCPLPYDVVDWFIDPWRRLYSTKKLRVRNSRKSPRGMKGSKAAKRAGRRK